MERFAALQEIPRLLLVRLRSLGDSILTLPLIEALHQWRCELKLGVVIEAPFAPVFQNHPAIEDLIILKTRRGYDSTGLSRLSAILELRKRRYPAVFNLHGGTTSMLLTLAAGARMRVGQESHRASWIYTGRIPSSREIWQKKTLHTVEHQLSFVKWLGLPLAPQSATLHVSDQARTAVAEYLKKTGVSEFFLLQPTATLRTKQWPADRFAELGDWLYREYGLPVIYTAAEHEAEVLQRVFRAARERHIYKSDLSLPEHFALIDRCRVFIGNDSGPMHAAAALRKPIVAIWGSSNYDAWHPWCADFEAVRTDLPCIPCPGYECKVYGEPRCVLDIPVCRVAEACSKIISKAATDFTDCR